MSFLIEHQYVILYFSGAFFSFFAMLSYVKVGNMLVGGRRKMNKPEEFFDDFDNDDLEALLDESFETYETGSDPLDEDRVFAMEDKSIDLEEGEVKRHEPVSKDPISPDCGD